MARFFSNPFHPYFFLEHVRAGDLGASWVVVLAHELEAQDTARDIAALSQLLGIHGLKCASLPDADQAARSLVLSRFQEGVFNTLVMSGYGYHHPVWDPASLAKKKLILKTGQAIEREDLIRRLLDLGFSRAEMVESAGEFAVRGQVLDLYASTLDDPLRILFAFDQIESIRTFNIVSQESIAYISQAEILPVKEEATNPMSAFLSKRSGMVAASEALWKDLQGEKIGEGEVFVFDAHQGESLRIPVASNAIYAGNVKLFAKEALGLQREGYDIHLTAPTTGEAERLAELLTEIEPWSKEEAFRVSVADLRFGFRDTKRKLWVVTSTEIFSKTPAHVWRPPARGTRRLTKSARDFRENAFELKLGDYVVHETYGIARYRGIDLIADRKDKIQGEFLKLEFAKGDHLYVPIEDFYLVHSYASLASSRAPRLSSLDARSFDLIKARVREEVRKFCQELVALWAKRTAKLGFSFEKQSHWENEFAASVPFDETEDQERAIAEVLKDMEASYPMERLLLGDVGFGKTEVAMRAAFRAVSNARQVVLLAPTTVLAEQHFRTFQARFAPYPFKVGLFSRFSGPKEIEKGLQELKKGDLDIAIGTHRLLQKDVNFKDLGLLIIDEEHRFGVGAKERLRFVASQVDTLYLSATPIPRTLSSALSGYKQISVIETAPVGRLPIETYVGAWDESAVNRAVRYEMSRGGQVFYVLNDIERLPSLAKEIEGMVPGARSAVYHGQMATSKLESIMHQFLQGNLDVLVASSIIESGLDIPTVNTLIIEEAQNFGLSELYQLRGRIGRANLKAYAYFFYPRGRSWNSLSQIAQERLAAIQEFVELGSGMRLALKDLEIRGSGELLGVKQHGFVTRVGLELFTKLLNEEMDALKRKSSHPAALKTSSRGFPKVHINASAFIPQEFVPNEAERMAYYRRFSRAESDAELLVIFDELKDRCGPLPVEVENLNLMLRCRIRGRLLGLSSLEEVSSDVFQFGFKEDGHAPGDEWVSWLLKKFAKRVRFVEKGKAFRLSEISNLKKLLDFLDNSSDLAATKVEF